MRFKSTWVVLVTALLAACSAPAVPSASPGTSQTPLATATATSQLPNPSIDPTQVQAPSAASLIQQAVAEGRLDEVTSLEYRAMAMFGLPGLPAEFAAGVPRSDSAALAEIAAMFDDLSEADQARLQPYLLRPTQPGSVFYASGPVAIRAGAALGQDRRISAAPAACRTWIDSGDLDNRFKVWACADVDAQAAEIDVAVVVTLVQAIWDKMSNDMGGPPEPDAYGANVPAEYGGDARIDFYALHLGQVMYRDGPIQIPATAAAATSPAPPYTNTDGSPRNASSAFMLLNIDTLEADDATFTLDLIHEFFHALQLAHNFRATYQGATEHWLVESSATWAETFYRRDLSEDPHTWFFAFQATGLGLQSSDPDHQYASYVWPFYMEQEKNAQAVFNAWKQTDQIAPRDFAAVTAAVGAQVPFDARFREFAVRNLNLNEVLRPANVTRYDELDGNFYDDSPPIMIPGAPVSPGSPYVSPAQSIPDLAARYFEPEFSQDSRKVTISIAQLQPAGQVDGDFLAHYTDGSWKRIPIQGGVLQYCRDDDGWDIDRGFLVVSNHGVQGTVSGSVEIDAKNTCVGDVRLHGTFTGHYSDFLQDSSATFDVIVVWHRPNDIHDRLNFQFESGSFTFSTTVDGACGGSRSEGGPLTLWGEDATALILGDPQDRSHEVHGSLIDYRLEQGGLVFAFVADYPILSGATGCEPPYESHGSVPTCAMEFKLETLDTLKTSAECEEGELTWTGHLVEI